MPFTFLAHQAVVLPLKAWRPRWFAGTALVIGSMAPDFEYFIRGTPRSTVSHTLPGQVLFCLPITLVAVYLLRRVVAVPLFSNLPRVGPLDTTAFARLGAGENPGYWRRAVVSALIGSGSHCLWDGFTHSYGWFVLRSEALRAPLFTLGGRSVPVYKLLQHGSTVVGGMAALGMLVWIAPRFAEWERPMTPTAPVHARRLLLGVTFMCGVVLILAAATTAHRASTLATVVDVAMRAVGLSAPALVVVTAGLRLVGTPTRAASGSRRPPPDCSDSK